jgi:hypothetical protein
MEDCEKALQEKGSGHLIMGGWEVSVSKAERRGKPIRSDQLEEREKRRMDEKEKRRVFNENPQLFSRVVLCASNLPFSVADEDVIRVFKAHGYDVLHAHVVRNSNEQSEGFDSYPYVKLFFLF